MTNYFNQLSFRNQKQQLAHCRFMQRHEFEAGCEVLKHKSIVIVGCGAQGLNQGLNMRDSGLNVSYALREASIRNKNSSYQRAVEHDFKVGSYSELIPGADLVYNLTPDKQHSSVVETVMPLMRTGSILAYSHGFNIVEEGQQIRNDITVVMCAPKCPGTEVRAEYKRGFGVPTLIAVHPDNDPLNSGLSIAKALAVATGGDRAGVLESSFVAEVKSDLMGEQTILCGMLQTASVLAFESMQQQGLPSGYSAKLIQQGLETVTEALKQGGITNMMDRLNNPSKLHTHQLSEELKSQLRPLFYQHMDHILSGKFSEEMMGDWKSGDKKLLHWREQTSEYDFEKAPEYTDFIPEQDYFDKGIFLVAMIKAGVELAFDVMVESGILPESAYYESLHETPLIANTIARKRLYEMNVVISDTAEYGNYLFANTAIPLLRNTLMPKLDKQYMGNKLDVSDNQVDNKKLVEVNEAIRQHPVEIVGRRLRGYMSEMKSLSSLVASSF
ncbi:MAG: ketol-acid reductoisomerase [Gammaproteobacteria bacterium]|nr:ketol-acid reductoisomerase [Gammaproteobacteria bacterium]